MGRHYRRVSFKAVFGKRVQGVFAFAHRHDRRLGYLTLRGGKLLHIAVVKLSYSRIAQSIVFRCGEIVDFFGSVIIFAVGYAVINLNDGFVLRKHDGIRRVVHVLFLESDACDSRIHSVIIYTQLRVDVCRFGFGIVKEIIAVGFFVIILDRIVRRLCLNVARDIFVELRAFLIQIFDLQRVLGRVKRGDFRFDLLLSVLRNVNGRSRIVVAVGREQVFCNPRRRRCFDIAYPLKLGQEIVGLKGRDRAVMDCFSVFQRKSRTFDIDNSLFTVFGINPIFRGCVPGSPIVNRRRVEKVCLVKNAVSIFVIGRRNDHAEFDRLVSFPCAHVIHKRGIRLFRHSRAETYTQSRFVEIDRRALYHFVSSLRKGRSVRACAYGFLGAYAHCHRQRQKQRK